MKKTKSGLLIVFLILFTFFITPKNVINIEGMTLENLYINGVSVEYRNSGISVQIPTQYVTPERELRAVWVSRFAGDIGDISTVQNFKKEYLAVLDKMEEYNLNTIIFHVRTHHDAFYRSSINKQSFRIGNINQSFDAIEWAIEETHKRGIEFHAWMNPYRIGGTSITEIQSEYADFPDNPVHNSDNILMGTNGAILNPGEPAVREFLIDTVMELIENYDVDAIHFDDYFYANGIDDSKTMNKPGYNPKGLGVADWRREQVNIFIRDLSQAIRTYNQENNRYVQFGISPTGIYRNGGSGFAYGGSDTYDVNGNFITSGSNTSGQEHYESYLFSDTKKWVDNEWIDYIIPQSYWGFTRDVAKYADIVDWWAKVVRYKNVNLYTGTGLYMATSGSGGDSWLTNPQEITMQIRYNTKHPEILGNSIYSYKHIITPPGLSGAGLNTLKTEMWNTKVLRPVIKSMAGNPLGQVRGFSVSRNSNQNVLTWEHLLGARGYVIYRNSGEIDFNDHSQILDIVGFEEVETLSYIDQNVGNENYVYGIRALNGANELGEGTLEVEGGPSDQYTITVLTNIGQNLAYVMNTNSLYGNTNQVIIDDSNQTQYRYNFLTENNKIITYDKEYLFRVTTDHQFTAYFVEAGKIGVSFVNLNDDLISFQMVNSLEDVIYPDDPGDIGFYRFVTWSRYDISDGDIVYRAVYERIDDEHYVVNIFDGINSYQEFVKFGQIITVEKNLPHQYSYWLVDGQKHSYDEILEIAVYNDLTIELVSGQITNDGFIHLRNNIVSNDNYFIYFGKFNLPLNALLLETGILLSKNPSDNLVLTNNNIEKLRALTISPTNEFAIKKTDINYNETVYARGYLVYIDNNDDINFVYTQNFEHTKVVPKNMFLITYDLQGGTLEQYVEMFKRKDLPLNLPIPTRLGYNFIGWYDVIKGEIITEITEAKDYYLRALWEEKPTQFYEISYRLNGGSWGFTNKEDLAEAFLKDFYSYLKLEGKLTTEDLQVFMHGVDKTSGFDGTWYDHQAHLYAANDKEVDASKQYFINQPEYNAKWIDFFEMMEEFTKAVNETQSFWGSTFTGHLRLKQYITGEKPADHVKDELMEMLPEVTKTATTYRSDRELILSKPIREGYKFVGWFEKEDFSGGAVEVIPAGSTENKVFYALWEPDYQTIEYEIAYELDGGILENPFKKFTASDLPIELPIPTKTGYRFGGWVDTNGNDITHITVLEDITVYAVWEELEIFTISFVSDDSILIELKIIYLEDLPIELPVITKKGYNFIGWTLDINSGDVIEEIIEVEGNITLYAVWEEKTLYTILFYSDGTLLANYTINYTVDDLPIQLPSITKTDAMFIGWYSDPFGFGPLYQEITFANNYTLYAIWEESQMTLLEEIVSGIPRHITTDYEFPSQPGLSFTYDLKHYNDDFVFDLETGALLKLRVTHQTRTIIAKFNNKTVTFEVDFGVVTKDEIGHYYYGNPASISTHEESNGGVTYLGWSGYTLKRGQNVHFISQAIELNGSGLITTPLILNPSGGTNSLGTLYVNVGNNPVSFTLNSLGSRIDDQSANSDSAVIVIDENGIVIHRYNNKTDRSTIINLSPGAALWVGKYLDRLNNIPFGRSSDFTVGEEIIVAKYQIV